MGTFAGLDVSQTETTICIVDERGGVTWRWHGAVLRGRAGHWDARGARVTSVLPDGRACYDGRATAEENWFERTGRAVPAGEGPDLRALGAGPVAPVRYLDVLPLQGTLLAFLGYTVTPYILTLLAIGELVTDQLPSTPSRKVPLQFGARIVTGALAGAAIGTASDQLIAGLVAGVIGAVLGTFGGAAARARLAAALGRDRPAAIVEDLIAIGGAFLIVSVVP